MSSLVISFCIHNCDSFLKIVITNLHIDILINNKDCVEKKSNNVDNPLNSFWEIIVFTRKQFNITWQSWFRLVAYLKTKSQLWSNVVGIWCYNLVVMEISVTRLFFKWLHVHGVMSGMSDFDSNRARLADLKNSQMCVHMVPVWSNWRQNLTLLLHVGRPVLVGISKAIYRISFIFVNIDTVSK